MYSTHFLFSMQFLVENFKNTFFYSNKYFLVQTMEWEHTFELCSKSILKGKTTVVLICYETIMRT